MEIKYLLNSDVLYKVNEKHIIKYDLLNIERKVFLFNDIEIEGKLMKYTKASNLIHKFWFSKEWEWKYECKTYITIPLTNDYLHNENVKVWYNGRVFQVDRVYADKDICILKDENNSFIVHNKWIKGVKEKN